MSKMKKTPEYEDLLQGMVVIDSEKPQKFYPANENYLKENEIPEEKWPYFEVKVLNEPDQIRMSRLVKRVYNMTDKETIEMFDIVFEYLTGWENVYGSNGLLDFNQDNFKKLTVPIKTRIAGFLSKISGLHPPEKLALK
jgi:hypothetical protein